MNIDAYGHCVICHRNLIIERVSDGKVISMFTPDKDETEFVLNDGSRMRVCICKPCKEGTDLKDKKVVAQIMEAVVNGWQKEVDTMVADETRPEWDEKRAEEHMRVYKEKSIDFHSDSFDKHAVESKIEEIKNKEMRKL